MPPWNIEFYKDEDNNDPVAEFILTLTPAERGRFLKRLEVLELKGLNAGEEYLHKVFGRGGRRKERTPRDKLWELVMSKSEHNPRVLLFGHKDRRLILLHGFSKSGRPNDKIPESEIATAEKRMIELLEKGR